MPKKISKSAVPKSARSGVKVASPDDDLLRFSFKFFDPSDDEVCPSTFSDGYTQSLMQRLRDLSSWRVSEFQSAHHKAVRVHTIDWTETQRPDGFSNLNEQFQSYPAWQFSVSANEYGRVHGLLIGNCFHIIWLDCNHIVYG